MDAELRINAYEISWSKDNIHILQMPQWWWVRVWPGYEERSECLGRVEKEGNNTVYSFALRDSDRDESKYSWRSMKKKKRIFDLLWEEMSIPLILIRPNFLILDF